MSDETFVADINALTAENRGLRLLLEQAEARVAALTADRDAARDAMTHADMLWQGKLDGQIRRVAALTAALEDIRFGPLREEMIEIAQAALDAARGGVMGRVVCQFSCGAASAVATKLALAQYADRDVLIVNAFLVEEDADNRRFLADCERWFGHPITVLRDEKYGASTDAVWRRKRYLVGPHGAPCSLALKRTVLDAVHRHDDLLVFGYTVEERNRFDNFVDRHPLMHAVAPLIDHSLTKSDCLAMVERAGIMLPRMYRLGYHNANCVGCPKGGEGYWNKIRRDFPERFEEVAAIQEEIGPGAYFFRDRDTGRRYSLRDLPPDKGRHDEELSIECSFFCLDADAALDAAGGA